MSEPGELERPERLGVLERLALLDTPPEEVFDRLARCATQLTGAPVSMVVLVSDDRQFFKSQVGLPEPLASERETSLAYSLCKHVVANRAPLIVNDARRDRRVQDNLAIGELGIVAYAGVPLVCEDECVGSFCVIDAKPRTWSDEDMSVVRDLAGAATAELSLRLANADTRRALASLSASEERYESLVMAMNEGVVLVYPDGTIEPCNAAAARILRVRQGTGRTSAHALRRVVGEDGRAVGDEDLPAMKTLRTGEIQRDAVLGLDAPDGGRTWVSVATAPLVRAGEAIPYAAVCSITDITEPRATRVALAASEQAANVTAARFSSVLEAATEYAMVGSALDGTITVFNRGAERMLGHRSEEVVGLYTPALLYDARELEERAVELGLAGGLDVLLASARLREPVKREWTYMHRDGRRIPVEATVSGIRDATGALTGFIGIAEDITARKRAEAALAAQSLEQEALRTVATLIASEAQPRAVFAAAAEHAARVLGSVTGVVFNVEESGEARAVGVWSHADLPRLPLGELLDRDEATATGAVLQSGRAEVAHYKVARAALRNGPAMQLESGAAVPITIDGRLWGVVAVAWADRSATDPETLPRLARFADLLSLAITGAEARERLSMVASTDHLTGLANQRTFSDRLEDEVRRASRHGRPLSLVLVDLDHFKLVNDTHGHDAGNRVLAELAERLVDLARGGEIVARVGGEEFAWILPETDAAGAFAAAERVRLAIAAKPFPGVGRLTTSVGICSLADAANARELFRHADLALYWAKSLGRNTTFQFAPETLELMPPDARARKLEAGKTLAAVRALAASVDAKDSSTERHSERVAEIAAELARTAGWEEARVEQLHAAALVHDVGKICVPDHVLLKPGSLSDEEYDQIKPHAAIGAHMVTDLLSVEQVAWIRHHHERFDGAGYPDGLQGVGIPDGARILSVADSWDAMTVARPYGVPRTTANALEEVARCSGAQLCPDAVAGLVGLLERRPRVGPDDGAAEARATAPDRRARARVRASPPTTRRRA